jgi:hypothetical protein
MTENTITLAEDEVKEVAVPQVEGKDHYRVNIQQGKVRIGDTKNDTFRGSIGVTGDRGKVTPEKQDTIWLRNVGINKAKVEIVPRGLEIDWYPNQQIEVTNKTFPGVEPDEITSSSAGETKTFKDQEIPDGASLAIKTPSSNSGNVLIEGVVPVGSQFSSPVSNMSNIELEFTEAGDTAYAVAEVDQ